MLVKNTSPIDCRNVIVVNPKIAGMSQFHNSISGRAHNTAITLIIIKATIKAEATVDIIFMG